MDGTQALPAMFQAMQQARDSINLEYFIFEDVEFNGIRLSDLLITKLRSGVAVNIIYDAYGSQDTPASVFATLRNAGANVVEFNPIGPIAALTGHSPNHRDHRKITVVDGRIAFTGGINLSKTYETRQTPVFPPTATPAMPIGVTPRCRSKVRPSPNCKSCSSIPGTSRTDRRSRAATTSRLCRARRSDHPHHW